MDGEIDDYSRTEYLAVEGHDSLPMWPGASFALIALIDGDSSVGDY